MKKYFYSHLVNVEFLEIHLETLGLSLKEQEDLLELAHQNIHNIIIDEMLSSLQEQDKRKFLELLAKKEHEKIWEHLNEKIDKAEDKIKSVIAQIKADLARDIKKIS